MAARTDEPKKPPKLFDVLHLLALRFAKALIHRGIQGK
jgi:hypothetical protein